MTSIIDQLIDIRDEIKSDNGLAKEALEQHWSEEGADLEHRLYEAYKAVETAIEFLEG